MPGPAAITDFDTQARRELGDRFRIEGIVRRGPRSIVYRAAPAGGNEILALKVIARDGHPERFERGAEIARSMDHPHVIAPRDFGETAHFWWYSMPLGGPSLDRVLGDDGPFDLKPFLRILEQVGSALQYAHRRGIVHGNLKPENILVGTDGWTLVGDFAVPGALDRIGSEQAPQRLTTYVAPELRLDRAPTPSADQYSLAVLVHECLTGSVPSVPGSPDEASSGNPRVALPRVTGYRELPAAALPALRRALAPNPSERFPTVLAFIATLDRGPMPVAPTFAPSPRKKDEPHVLTMEPRSRGPRLVRWLMLAAVVVAAAIGSKQLMRTEAGQRVADRFDRWYDADEPPGGLMLGQKPLSTPSAPAASRPDTTLATAPPATVAQAAPRPTAPVNRPPAAQPQRAARRPAPAPVTRAPDSTPAPAPAEPGKLFVNSTPWGTVYLDGRPVGNTPLLNLDVPAGAHVVRIARDGFEDWQRPIDVQSGEPIRLTGITLQEKR